MTKKVLIITSRSERTASWLERERYVRDFCEAVQAQLPNTDVIYTTYDDLQYTITNDLITIFDVRNQLDLRAVALVQFKNWSYEAEEAPMLALYLQRHGVAFYNPEVLLPVASGKLSQMIRLAFADIPIPDTFYARKSQLIDLFSSGKLPAGMQLPLIMKDKDGSRGDDNYLITSPAQAVKILQAADPEQQFVLQKFIANDGDYRILFVGLDNPPLLFHRQGVAGSHLNNTSKGGAGTFINLHDFPAKQLQLARRAAETLQREIGGVDVIVDRTSGEAYVLEVNGTPALATGYGLEQKVTAFSAFVHNALEAQEEE